MPTPTAADQSQAPDFTVYFPGGTYEAAICGYRDAQYWALDRGLVFGNVGCGLIRITFCGGEAPTIIREEADRPGWQAVLYFRFDPRVSVGEIVKRWK